MFVLSGCSELFASLCCFGFASLTIFLHLFGCFSLVVSVLTLTSMLLIPVTKRIDLKLSFLKGMCIDLTNTESASV